MKKHIVAFLPLCILLFISCTPESSGDNGVAVSLNFSTASLGDALPVPGDFAGVIHSGYSDTLNEEYALLGEMGVVWVHQDLVGAA